MKEPAELQVQIFGRRDSRDTQRALRFFAERRVKVAFVDVARKPPALGELRRFAERFGSKALMDSESRLYRDAGLAYLSLDDGQVLERVLADPRLLKLPLVRAGSRVTIGVDDVAWKSWLVRT
ncbi:MAG TPA: ArsC/Spx/MgsR family protein [Candidatus Limnocylindrales bacterium]|nr:ArsC/Spx/MgsR family protein [Candidatus Limnocylindrales bacterium]